MNLGAKSVITLSLSIWDFVAIEDDKWAANASSLMLFSSILPTVLYINKDEYN